MTPNINAEKGVYQQRFLNEREPEDNIVYMMGKYVDVIELGLI